MLRVAVLLIVLLGAATARAQQTPGQELARRAFEEGVALENKHDYAAALEKFKESQQIKRTLGNRFHQAYCLEMMGKLAAALNEYEAVDAEAREANKAEVFQQTAPRLDTLRTRVPQLSLKLAGPKEAEVALDGAPISGVILDGRQFRVDPGEHVVTAQAPAHEPFKKAITLTEGASGSIDITLQKVEAQPPVTAPAPTKKEEPVTEPESLPKARRSYTLPIVTTAGAVVLLGAGIASFLVAGSAQSDAEQTCRTRVTCEGEQDKVRTFDALALTGFIGAAGLAALSVVLWTSKPASIVARGSWAGAVGRF